MTVDKESSKVHLGAVDRSWIAGAMLSVVIGAVTWGYKLDSRQTVHETRQTDIARRQDEMVAVLSRITDLIEAEKSRSDQHFPQIDVRLAEIERQLEQLGEQVRKGKS